MSDPVLILIIAGITYLSRAAALVLLPPARGRILGLVQRLPAPLFAGLAVFAIFGDDVTVPDTPTLAAVASALAVSPRRSLGLTLAAGMLGYLVVELML